jgi:MoaA/NifB/PqqE/SkfB family radical SAM enzyme
VALVDAARRLGYRDLKLQTNGLLLAYPELTRRLVEAGLTTVSLALRSPRADVHDLLVRRAGAWAGLEKALDVLAGHPSVGLEGDVLVSRSNAADLAPTLDRYAARGVKSFSLWLLCRLVDDEATRRELLPFSELEPHLVAAFERADALGVRLTSLHTPACVVPPAWRDRLYYPPELDLLVVNADGRSFWLEESPVEGGAPLPSCERCAWRPRCLGPRADYLEVFGSDEFVPIET